MCVWVWGCTKGVGGEGALSISSKYSGSSSSSSVVSLISVIVSVELVGDASVVGGGMEMIGDEGGVLGGGVWECALAAVLGENTCGDFTGVFGLLGGDFIGVFGDPKALAVALVVGVACCAMPAVIVFMSMENAPCVSEGVAEPAGEWIEDEEVVVVVVVEVEEAEVEVCVGDVS